MTGPQQTLRPAPDRYGKFVLGACLALAAASLLVFAAAPHRRSARSPAVRQERHPTVQLATATPLWNGDTFYLDPAGTSRGGGGALPPYQWSSAWESGRGFLRHSNTDPDVMGVTV